MPGAGIMGRLVQGRLDLAREAWLAEGGVTMLDRAVMLVGLGEPDVESRVGLADQLDNGHEGRIATLAA